MIYNYKFYQLYNTDSYFKNIDVVIQKSKKEQLSLKEVREMTICIKQLVKYYNKFVINTRYIYIYLYI